MDFPKFAKVEKMRCKMCRRNVNIDDGDIVQIGIIINTFTEQPTAQLTVSCPFCESRQIIEVPQEHADWESTIWWLSKLVRPLETATAKKEQQEEDQVPVTMRQMTLMDLAAGTADLAIGEPIGILTLSYLGEVEAPIMLSLRDVKLLELKVHKVLRMLGQSD